jgi:hypothetical protein
MPNRSAPLRLAKRLPFGHRCRVYHRLARLLPSTVLAESASAIASSPAHALKPVPNHDKCRQAKAEVPAGAPARAPRLAAW